MHLHTWYWGPWKRELCFLDLLLHMSAPEEAASKHSFSVWMESEVKQKWMGVKRSHTHIFPAIHAVCSSSCLVVMPGQGRPHTVPYRTSGDSLLSHFFWNHDSLFMGSLSQAINGGGFWSLDCCTYMEKIRKGGRLKKHGCDILIGDEVESSSHPSCAIRVLLCSLHQGARIPGTWNIQDRIQGPGWVGSSVGRHVIPILQGWGFSLPSGHIQEGTSDAWMSGITSQCPPPQINLKN